MGRPGLVRAGMRATARRTSSSVSDTAGGSEARWRDAEEDKRRIIGR